MIEITTVPLTNFFKYNVYIYIYIYIYIRFIFAFIMIGQIRADRKRSGRDIGAGSGMVLFGIGTQDTRSATELYVSTLPTKPSAPTPLI